MGQREICEILKNKYPSFVDYKTVLQLSKNNKSSVMRCLRQMKKRDEVELMIVIKNKIIQTLYRIREEK